jgi:serine/threonine-protein kinase
MVTRPRTVTAPPAYRPPAPYYEGTARRRAVWPWLLGILAVVIAGGAGYLLYEKIQDQLDKSQPVAVVDVRNILRGLAVQKLKTQGFDVKVVRRADNAVPVNEVADQNPSPGSRIAPSSTVTIFVSTGKPRVPVPDVRGLTLNDAISRLNDVHLTPDVHQVFSAAQSSTVVGQAPAGGDKVLINSKVRLNVSQGPRQVPVPNVVSQPYANAVSQLEGQDFNVQRRDENSDQPKGIVIAQDPQAGVNTSRGAKVTLTVSKGPGTTQVPLVTGYQRADAVQTLQASGFVVTIVMQDVTDPSQDGLVLAQNPRPGSKATKGAEATITVGHLVAQTTPTETVPTTPTTTEVTTTAPPPTTTAPPETTTTSPTTTPATTTTAAPAPTPTQ